MPFVSERPALQLTEDELESLIELASQEPYRKVQSNVPRSFLDTMSTNQFRKLPET